MFLQIIERLLAFCHPFDRSCSLSERLEEAQTLSINLDMKWFKAAAQLVRLWISFFFYGGSISISAYNFFLD